MPRRASVAAAQYSRCFVEGSGKLGLARALHAHVSRFRRGSGSGCSAGNHLGCGADSSVVGDNGTPVELVARAQRDDADGRKIHVEYVDAADIADVVRLGPQVDVVVLKT